MAAGSKKASTKSLKMQSQGAGQPGERFRAFTVKSKNRLNSLLLEIGIVEHSEQEHHSVATINTYRGIIDTASALSYVSPKIVNDLGLIPRKVDNTLQVHVDFYLPNVIRVTNVLADVKDITTPAECDCHIGMDVLSCGDITLSHKNGETQFSFRVPALGAEDFVLSHRKLYRKKTVVTAAARNRPCPCGSGKRYKNCCGKLD